MTRAMAALSILLLAAVPVQAQQHPQRHMMSQQMMGDHGTMNQAMMGPVMMGEGMGMLMQSGLATPRMILDAGDELGLTSDQRSRLEEMQSRLAEAIAPDMQAAMTAHEEAAATLRSDSPDLDAYRAALETAMENMLEAHIAQARAAVDARAVLTRSQREKLQTVTRMMHGMMGDGAMSHGMMRPGGGR